MHKQTVALERKDRTSRIIIEQNETVRLPEDARWLRAEFGHVWFSDGSRDVILIPGQTYNPDRPSSTVLSALGGQPAGLVIGLPCDDPSEQARARLKVLAYNRP